MMRKQIVGHGVVMPLLTLFIFSVASLFLLHWANIANFSFELSKIPLHLIPAGSFGIKYGIN